MSIILACLQGGVSGISCETYILIRFCNLLSQGDKLFVPENIEHDDGSALQWNWMIETYFPYSK